MRRTSELVLLVLAAIAVTAVLTPGAALAQEEPVEVENEATGLHCSLDEETCVHHIVGSHTLILHQFGTEIPISQCNDEYVATLDEDGNGYFHTYENDAGTNQACTRIMCNGTGESVSETEWPITNTGEYTDSQTDEGHFTFRFCLDNETDPNGPGIHCTRELNIENHGNHHYGFKTIDDECPILGMNVWVERDGEWESEASPAVGEHDIEIIH